MIKKLALAILIVSGIITQGIAFDLTFAGHYDTYSGSSAFGASFFAREELNDKIEIKASLDYYTANSYEAQCGVAGKIAFITLGAGFAYCIDNSVNNVVVPGLALELKLETPLKVGIEGSAVLSLAPANLYKAYSFRATGAFTFDTDNANAILKYSIKQSAEKQGLNHSALFQVNAYRREFPFRIMLGFGSDFLTKTEQEKLQLEVYVTGGMALVTEKAGTYFLRGKASPLSYRDISLPFELCLGVEFSLR